jgi:hypothetical protein
MRVVDFLRWCELSVQGIVIVLSLFVTGCQTQPNVVFETASATVTKNQNMVAGKEIDLDATSPRMLVMYANEREDLLLDRESRLVAFEFHYENPVGFKYFITIRQKSEDKSCRHIIDLKLDQKVDDHILLLDIPSDCGDDIDIYFEACAPFFLGSLNGDICPLATITAKTKIEIDVPNKGMLLYAGRISVNLQDMYPHRGTANCPVFKEIDYSFEHNRSFDNYFVRSSPLTGYAVVYRKASQRPTTRLFDGSVK